MNCKSGDLAVIVRSMAGNEGKIVLVVGPAAPGLPGDLGCALAAPGAHIWHCRAPRPVLNSLGSAETEFALPDTWLRPIRDPGDDARDESLEWKPVPVTVPGFTKEHA